MRSVIHQPTRVFRVWILLPLELSRRLPRGRAANGHARKDSIMRKHFVFAALVLGAFRGGGLAADSPAEKALREYYPPQSQFKLQNKTKENGVDIEHYDVTVPNGKATASVTTRGELVTTGWPVG